MEEEMIFLKEMPNMICFLENRLVGEYRYYKCPIGWAADQRIDIQGLLHKRKSFQNELIRIWR